MTRRMDIVITTIFPPTKGTQALSRGVADREGSIWVIGDQAGPKSYDLPHVRFYDIESQRNLSFRLARLLPEKSYTRKNLGYLLAIQAGARIVIETDDDNIPLPDFWIPRRACLAVRAVHQTGWFNVYRAFSSKQIWPRGFPLEELSTQTAVPTAGLVEKECLIQQSLANGDPDVDAVYRLILPLPVEFEDGPPIALDSGCWCPFNSQNATFFSPAFPLLYLPSFCTFRMTDIWRSLVAQRCLWEMDSQLAFTKATMFQERNEHNLLRDFELEVPGYLKNNRLRQLLENTRLRPGRSLTLVSENLERCYEALVRGDIISSEEIALVKAWNQDLASLPG